MSEFEVFKKYVCHFVESLQNFYTKCKFCEDTFAYHVTSFRKHLKMKHRDVLIDMTNKNRKEKPDEYVKYIYSRYVCVICNVKFVELEHFCDHLNSHFLDDLITYNLKSKRLAQYGKDDGKCTAHCKFCSSKWSIIFNHTLIYNHMKTYHEEELCDRICSLESSLLLALNAECMPPKIANKSECLRYIELKQNFLAECKICKREFTYVDIQNFRAHLFNEHDKRHQQTFISKAEEYCEKTPERYSFKLKCLICLEDVLKDFSGHLKSHYPVEVKNYEIMKHTWEYCSKHDDFAVQCNFCLTTVTLTISKTVKDHIDFHMKQLARNKEEIAGSSEIDNVQKLPSKITNESELWENYTKLESFQAKCQFCDFQDSYINVTKFDQHVEEKHIEVLLFEGFYGKEWPGIYFNFEFGDALRCLLCNEDVRYQNIDDWDQHLRKSHCFNKVDCYLYNCGWEWKYCDKIGDLEVKCNKCDEEISLEVELSHLQRHIENTHLINLSSTQEMHDVAGPSGSQLN